MRLHSFYGSREIARRVRLSRKIVRRVLKDHGCLPPPERIQQTSKLDAFHEAIDQRVTKGLTITRILREITEQGYSGGRSILAEHVRTLQSTAGLKPASSVKRRFETPPGEEMQVDWSPYRIPIAGILTTVHVFGCLLCSSRKLWVYAYRNERQPTLLEGLASAFEYFWGCCLRVVLDNMATAVLAHYGPDGKPIWHPRFLDFCRYYGFEPFACAIRDPDRKGKKEKSFRLVWEDFLKGSEFDSMEDLNGRLKIWLDNTPKVANERIHGTTRLVPNNQWLSERQFLIQLPDKRFSVCEQTIRVVDQDSTLSIAGTRYTVPSSVAGRSVAVHLFAEHFEVLNSHHHVVFSRRYVPDVDKGKLIIDETHYATNNRRLTSDGPGAHRLEQAFVLRFPTLKPFVDGLQLRMNKLTHIHLRALLRLAESYGEQALLAAATRAQEYRRFDAWAVERILERHYPLLDDAPLAPLGGAGPIVLGEVEPGSLDDYSHLDGNPASEETENKDDSQDYHGT
ncbi:IS21 family transposase [Candidatus Bathyarchaeota archaeon]|nr:IS21 family transposase [Candidatus Bathyarchaeota archaeon]